MEKAVYTVPQFWAKLCLILLPGERFRRVAICETSGKAMKRIEDKIKRKVKYWRISFSQASGRDRLSLGLFSLLMLVYAWWVFLVV